MENEAPPWAHMLGRMAAMSYRTARGQLRFRDPDELDDDGQLLEGAHCFWFKAPDWWRVEDDRGVTHVQNDQWVFLRDSDDRMQRMPRATTSWGFSFGHPWTLFGTEHDRGQRFSRPDDFSIPLGPGVARTVADRPAWEYVLAPPPHKRHPLHVVIDDATGTVLRLAVPEVDSYIEVTEFVPDIDVEDAKFTWEGATATDWHDEHAAHMSGHRWLEQQRLPVPRWWPSGVAYTPMQGDPESGSFAVDLEVMDGASLARWPIGGKPPRYWQGRLEDDRHVHDWRDQKWQWQLSVSVPLSDEDLSRVIASIPAGEESVA